MAILLPRTKSAEFNEQISQAIFTLPHYWDKDSVVARAWESQIDTLINQSPPELHLLYAKFYTALGDVDQALVHAERFSTDKRINPNAAFELKAQILGNLGYFSQMRAHINNADLLSWATPRGGLHASLLAGDVSSAAEVVRRAVSNEELLRDPAGRAVAKAAALNSEIFEKSHEITACLDIAGAIMRSNKLMWLYDSPRFGYDADLDRFSFRFYVGITAAEAADLNAACVEERLKAKLYNVPASVSFIGTVPDDSLVNAEKFAEA